MDFLDNDHHHTVHGSTSKKVCAKVGKPKQEINSDPLGRMIGDCIEPITRSTEEDEFELVWKQRQELFDDQDLCYDSDPGEASFRMAASDTGAYTMRKEQVYDVKRSNSINIGGMSVVKGVGAKRMDESMRRRRPHFDALCDVSDDDDDDDQVATLDDFHKKQDDFDIQPGQVSFDESDDEFVDTCEGPAEIGKEEHYHIPETGPGYFDGNKYNDVVSKVQVSLNGCISKRRNNTS